MARPDRPADTPPASDPTRAAGPRRFDTVLRGYDRTQVDAHLAELAAENARLRRQAADADRRRQNAEQHASAAEGEFRTLQAQRQGSGPEEGFGFRAEKLLRLAEQEAAEARSSAAREASSLVDQARADAEGHRHEVEQALIARTALLDEQAGQRTAELQQRERQIAEQLAAARSEAESLHEAARRAAEQHRARAESAAEEVRVRAAQDARRLREQAEQEVARLTTVRHDVRAELGRLAEVLAAETAGDRPAGPAQPGGETTEPEPDGADPAAGARATGSAGDRVRAAGG